MKPRFSRNAIRASSPAPDRQPAAPAAKPAGAVPLGHPSRLARPQERSEDGARCRPHRHRRRRAGCLMRVLVATDAWHPQVNGVVRTLTSLAAAAGKVGFEVVFLTPEGFPSVPVPTY